MREAGAPVLGIADATWEGLPPELRDDLTEYYRVDDLHSTDQLRAAVSHFVDRHGPIDRLESLNEYWLETDALLRSEFDEWGDDVNHDWPWWRRMLPHYLERLGV